MVEPKFMCRKHLLGEHVECHMFHGTLKKNHNVTGYIKNNLFEFRSLQKRHDDLVIEMKIRGYKHKTPLEVNLKITDKNILKSRINYKNSFIELMKRCKDCNERLLSSIK